MVILPWDLMFIGYFLHPILYFFFLLILIGVLLGKAML